MTTGPILRPEYRDIFVAFERDHAARWGTLERELV